MKKSKKSLRRSFSLLMIPMLLLSFCLVLTACSKGESEVKEKKSLETKKSDTKPLYTIKVLADPTITNVIIKSDETPIFKIIKEKFNIVFELIPISGDIKEQMNLMLAAGDYPEIIRLEGQDTVDKYIKAGALLPLDPYLDKSPNFKAFYKESIPFWRLGSGDGKLYNWDGYMPQDTSTVIENLDIAIRSDILEEAGWPNIVSSDDYVKLLTDAIKKHPETDGKKTIGLVAPFGESWGMTDIGPIMYEKGRYTEISALAIIWDDIDKKVLDMTKNDYTKEGFQFFNKLYRGGALDKECFTDKSDQVTDKLNSGRALSTWYTTWLIPAVNLTLEKAGKSNLEYITLPIQTPKQIANNEKRMLRTALNRPWDSISITKNAKYPERIMELMDWASTDEGQILLQSGIEGVHYTKVDGKRVLTEAYKNNLRNDKDYGTKQGFGIVSWLGSAACASKVDGQPFNLTSDPKVKDELLTQRVRDAYKAMGWKNSMQWWQDKANTAEVKVGVAATISINPTTEFGVIEAKIADLRVKYSAKLMQAKSDQEFETIYNTLLQEHEKLQPQKLIDEYNRLYTNGMKDLAQFMK